MGLVTLSCKLCRAKIFAEDVNIQQLVAKCRACNAVFEFVDQVKGGEEAAPPRLRGPVPMPGKFRMEEQAGGFVISWRWLSYVHVFLLFFTIAWDSFLIFWYGMAMGEGAPWIMFVFPIGHLAVGLGLTYVVLTGLLNRTTVTVERETLTVRHAPLPWPGNVSVATDQLDQLYCRRRISHGKHGPSYSFEVRAVTQEGRKMTLIKGLESEDQALFIEQQIESRLGIEDRPVAGE